MTLGTMADRIADELSRTDLTSQIQDAIRDAVKHYERQPFYFNEERAQFSTVSGQEYYSTTATTLIQTIAGIESLVVNVNDNSRYPLWPRTMSEMDEFSANAQYTGIPTDYTYYRRAIRLFPIPNAAYTIDMHVTKKQATLSATTDTNDFLDLAEELIRAAAKKRIYAHVIRDFDEAQVMEAVEQWELANLLGENVRLAGAGRVKPTFF